MGAVAGLAGASPFSPAGAQAVSWPTHGWRRSSPEAQGWTQGWPEHSTTSASGRFRSLTHQPYGDWVFEVRDPSGYVLVFGGE